MKRGNISLLIIGVVIFISLNVASASTNVTECTTLDIENEVYTLNQSINSSFDCLIINATNITLDCADYNITFGNESGGMGIKVGSDEEPGFDEVTIQGCYLIQNESGLADSAIFFGQGSENAIIYNNTIELYGNETIGIIIGDDSINADIRSNIIYSNGTNASGVEISDNGFNATIEGNLIITSKDDSPGIWMMENASTIIIYDNVIWMMGNRTLSDIAMAGVIIDGDNYDVNVSSNWIIVGYFDEENYGIKLDDYDDGEYEDWVISGGGYNASGIWVWGDNSTIEDNFIISFGDLGNGIFLNDVGGINISLNLIVTFGEQGHGILSTMSESASLLFYNNTIATIGENASGIYLGQDSNDNISLNAIYTYGNYSYGIFLNQSHNTTLVNNNISTDRPTSYVLYLDTSAGESIYNNFFNTSTDESGVFVANSDPSDYNTTKTAGTNIVGNSYIGGNYWTNVNGTGYSDDCAETDGDYICDSSYDLGTGGDAVDYLPLSLTTSYNAPIFSSNPNSDNENVGYPLFVINESQLINGYIKVMYQNWGISFKLGNESHTFKVENINITNTKISISSETQEATFSIGEEKKFELSEDNYYDILVKLNSITSNNANFTIQKIHEEIVAEQEKGEQENEKIGTEDREQIKWIICGMIIAGIILILIGVGHTLKRKRK